MRALTFLQKFVIGGCVLALATAPLFVIGTGNWWRLLLSVNIAEAVLVTAFAVWVIKEASRLAGKWVPEWVMWAGGSAGLAVGLCVTLVVRFSTSSPIMLPFLIVLVGGFGTWGVVVGGAMGLGGRLVGQGVRNLTRHKMCDVS
jgi:hypothetical protein